MKGMVETSGLEMDKMQTLDQPEDGPWKTLTRRSNLLALGEKYKGKIDAKKMMEILDTPIEKGGATRPAWAVQQIVVVPSELKL